MWKKLAGASAAFAAGLLCLCAGARAEDLGLEPFFATSAGIQTLSGTSGGGVLWKSGASSPVSDTWDTVLFQGSDLDAAVNFEASRRVPGGSWTAWQPAPVKRFPRGRFWGKAVFPWTAPGAVRLRAVAAGPTASRKIDILSVEVFDGGAMPSQRSAPPMMLEVGGGTRPAIIGREEWGAKPAKEPYEPMLPYRITLHHTSGIQPMNAADAEAELRFIQDFHQNGRGWSDIAYHFLIDGAGDIFEGRPETVIGSHTLHHNDGNIGIALMGNYQPPKSDRVTQAERDALVRLGRYLVQHYGIDPDSLKGHRDYRRTDCPGDNVYVLIPALRRQFAQEKLLAGRRFVKRRAPRIARARLSFDGAK